MAQEIQVRLVIEAEQRRRQEEDDEDIARILQQKELQEEKRRKKPHAAPPQHGAHDESHHPESRERSCRSPREPAPEQAASHARRARDRQRAPPLLSEGLDLEVLGSSSEVRKARSGRRCGKEKPDGQPSSREKPRKLAADVADERISGGEARTRGGGERKPASRERPLGPSSPARGGGGSRERRPRSRERPPPLRDREGEVGHGDRRLRERWSPGPEKAPRPPDPVGDVEERRSDRHGSGSGGGSPTPDRRGRLPREDRPSPRPPSRDPRRPDSEAAPRRGHRRDTEGERDGASDGLHGAPSRESPRGYPRSPGTKSRGTKDAVHLVPRAAAAQDQESYDAEIARRLQEEELLASHADRRAAQVAQDEEIARLLMAEEKKAYRRAKEREKASEKKKQEPDRKQRDLHELGPPRSREGHEAHRARSDKPTWLPL
ncbi:coiled-coil domain-containing protein 50 [Varanus komodoensis]|uniref:coiled-coil domain-containing protein 50 n=1 Tax=Varanus komodoensis TaxID=61221 RepID=UPI001CF7C74D|nr:coiled-coil domain-containing protein 50 [Varanus komodoensis]